MYVSKLKIDRSAALIQHPHIFPHRKLRFDSILGYVHIPEAVLLARPRYKNYAGTPLSFELDIKCSTSDQVSGLSTQTFLRGNLTGLL